jgi:predicted permease
MTLVNRLASIARWTFRRAEAERDLESELETFVEMAAAEQMESGCTPGEARRRAALELGGKEQVKERVRTLRHGAWLDEAAQDARHAVRMFIRNPGFSLVVVLTLALGIGANTAIFTLIDALMLRWLPVRNPQELVLVEMRLRDSRGPSSATFSYAIVRALEERREIFSGVAGFSGWEFMTGTGSHIAKVHGALVTGDFYATLGLAPVAGRLLMQTDDEPGAPLVAVISDGYWARQFDRNRSAVGRDLRINGVPVTIVGVSPPGFVGANVGEVADMTMTAATLPRISPESAALLEPGNFWLRALARPADRVSRPEATARLQAAWQQVSDRVISPQWPASRRNLFADATFELSSGGTGWTMMRQTYRQPLFALMGVVALVLAIACANVASLTLARGSLRQREVGVRLAIGASRGRIVRQILVESAVLSLSGAACGLLFAWASARFLVSAIATSQFDVIFDLTPNWRVLGFTAAVAMASSLLFGLVPALQSSAVRPSATLKQDLRMSGSRAGLLSSLVTIQVALSLLLIVAAGLFGRTLHNLENLNPGFNRDGVLIVQLEGRRSPLGAAVLEEIRRLPGVVSASLSTHTPLSGSLWSEPAVPIGQPLPDNDTTFFVGAGPGYFETMQTAIVAGREFTERDATGAPAVVIVNEAFARRVFPNQQSLGQRLSASVRGERKDLEIVGVAKDTNVEGLRKAPPPTVYVPYLQLRGNLPTTLEVRGAVASLGRIEAEIHDLLQPKMPQTPVEVRPLSEQVEASIARERLMATMAGAFGALALVVASVGLYGLMAYGVARRTREIGIRMALGAPRRQVIAMVLRDAARPVTIGVVSGIPAVWLASRAITSMLFGVHPADAATVTASIVVLMGAALAAAYVPARRASLVDPMAALRNE